MVSSLVFIKWSALILGKLRGRPALNILLDEKGKFFTLEGAVRVGTECIDISLYVVWELRPSSIAYEIEES
jgi:hypothetical protein